MQLASLNHAISVHRQVEGYLRAGQGSIACSCVGDKADVEARAVESANAGF